MIRLQRVGRKHEPVFRLVLTDSKNGPKSGKFLEILGSYDTRRKDDAVFKIEVDKKFIDGKKINVLSKKTPIIKEKDEATTKEPKTEATETEIVKESAPTPTENEPIQPEKIIEETPEEVVDEKTD
ncbi:MAG: hypothetical protein UR80_C0040G0004 [Parcubacteria group bacterium GW2011_GWB1_35_5]|nr:MAG: hypothetical protein UR80_C0040G0004 [Parcubacteria group bacterium GW2011_GWB1_35_5]